MRPIPRLFLRPKFSRPIPRLFSRPNIFKTDTETFFRDQNFRDRDQYSQKIEKSLDAEKSLDEMSHSAPNVKKKLHFSYGMASLTESATLPKAQRTPGVTNTVRWRQFHQSVRNIGGLQYIGAPKFCFQYGVVHIIRNHGWGGAVSPNDYSIT